MQRIMQDINRLSVLTDEVLSYLQAKGVSGDPEKRADLPVPVPVSIVRSEAPEADVNVFADKDAWLWTDKGLPAPGGVQRAAQRHHLRRGGGAHRRGSGRGAWEVRISVRDRGPARLDRICPCCWSPSTGARRP